jgi:hypothetical protein
MGCWSWRLGVAVGVRGPTDCCWGWWDNRNCWRCRGIGLGAVFLLSALLLTPFPPLFRRTCVCRCWFRCGRRRWCWCEVHSLAWEQSLWVWRHGRCCSFSLVVPLPLPMKVVLFRVGVLEELCLQRFTQLTSVSPELAAVFGANVVGADVYLSVHSGADLLVESWRSEFDDLTWF